MIVYVINVIPTDSEAKKAAFLHIRICWFMLTA